MKFLLSFVFSSVAFAAVAQSVPPLINYQGRLANADGTPFPTADYELRVSLYNAATNGDLIWGPQVFDGGQGAGRGPRLPIVQGYFNLMLGPVDIQGRSVLDAFGESNRFVEVTVSNRPPIGIRQQILPSPFAVQAANGSPPGTIVAFGGENIPEGWLLCDGRAFTSAQYPRLWLAISNFWGGSESSFYIPDLRGLFLRGVANSPNAGPASFDPDANSRVEIKPGGHTGNRVGSWQNDALQDHGHQIYFDYFAGGDRRSIPGWHENFASLGIRGSPIGLSANELISRGVGGTPRAAAENRPKNAYVNYIIKY